MNDSAKFDQPLPRVRLKVDRLSWGFAREASPVVGENPARTLVHWIRHSEVERFRGKIIETNPSWMITDLIEPFPDFSHLPKVPEASSIPELALPARSADESDTDFTRRTIEIRVAREAFLEGRRMILAENVAEMDRIEGRTPEQTLAMFAAENRKTLERLVERGVFEGVGPDGSPIAPARRFSTAELGEGATMANVMVALKLFPSLSQARKNGWNTPLELGAHTLTKKKIRVEIVP